MTSKRKSKRGWRPILSVLLIACLFSTTLSDLYIHSAHAGHNHETQTLSATENVSADTDLAADDAHSGERQLSANENVVHTFSHGCLVFIVLPLDGFKERQARNIEHARPTPALTARPPNRLERPPRLVS